MKNYFTPEKLSCSEALHEDLKTGHYLGVGLIKFIKLSVTAGAEGCFQIGLLLLQSQKELYTL